MQKYKHARASNQWAFKSGIGGEVRILRPIIGIACDVSKVIAAVGAKLASLFLSFIQLWCEPNLAIT